MQSTTPPTPALAPAAPATITITNADGTTQTLALPRTRGENQALESTEIPGNPNDIPDNAAAMGGAFIALVLFPLTLVFARNLWKRGSRAAGPPLQQLSGEATQRLERLEQGMEAIAIEIERVAEGQRFVTRILSDGQSSPLPVSTAQITDTRAQASR